MLIVLLTVAASCNRRQNTNKPLLTPSSSGNPYEVMVVAEIRDTPPRLRGMRASSVSP